MTSPRVLVLLGLLALAACGPGPVTPPHPPVTAPVTEPRPLGLYELSLTDLNGPSPTGVIVRAGLRGQAAEVQGLQFTPVSFGTYTDETARVRYLRASFRVTNGSGQALTRPVFVPVDTDGQDATTGTTPFKGVQYFDGSDASGHAARLTLDTPHRLNSLTGTPEVDPDATPLVRGLDTRGLVVTAPAGTTVTRVFEEGWQGRSVAAGGEQIVTFATRIPMAAAASQDPFRFRLVFAVIDDPALQGGDSAAPTVQVQATPATLTAAGSVTLQADATDDQGVTKVDFYDGEVLLGTDREAPFEWTAAYTAADNGERRIRAVATDPSGNAGEGRTTLTVAIAPPFLGSGPATLTADLVRSNRGEAVTGSSVRLYRSGDRSRVLAEAQTDMSGAVQFSAIPEGTYDLVFSKAGSAGSEVLGAVATAGQPRRLKVAQFDAQNPTADTAVPQLALLTPSALDGQGRAADWKALTPGTVMNGAAQLRAYTTAANAAPLLLKYLMFSLVSFDASGQMAELRGALTSIDPGHVTPGPDSQDSGQVTLDPAGLSGDVFVQVSALDFNNNRSAYLVPVRLERAGTPGTVSAPTGVSAVGYTLSERLNYIYRAPGTDLTPQGARPDSNSWVSVSWDQPASTDGLTGFRVLRATAKEGPYVEVAFAGTAQCSAATRRCTASDNTATLEVGQDYYYRVKALGTDEAVSAAPDRPSTHLLPPFAPQLLTPGPDQSDVDLLPTYAFKTNAFAGGATGLRVDLRVSDTFTAAVNSDAPPLRVLRQNGTASVTGVGTDTRDYSRWVTYDAATDTLKVPHDLTRVRSGLTPVALQANRRYSWLLHRAYAYRLQDPTQPESATNPVVAYAVYSDPDTTKVVPGGVTQSVSAVHHFITRP